jgi:hypothetical protein
MDPDPSFAQGAATVAAVCGAGVAFAFVMVAVCARRRPARRASGRAANVEEAERRARLRAYEGQYFEALSAAKARVGDQPMAEDDLGALSAKSIEEETPVGLVRMEYDRDTETFRYYTDARNIHYKILDTVARSFCLAHDCPQICVHYKDEFDRAKAEAVAALRKADNDSVDGDDGADGDDEKGEDDPASPTKHSSVFASFKSYNTRASKPVRSRTRILTENANRFSFAGTLKDRATARDGETSKAVATDPSLTFLAYKDGDENKDENKDKEL